MSPQSTSHQVAPAVNGQKLLSPVRWNIIGQSLRMSEREVEVVLGVIAGDTAAGIGETLGISPHTVHAHLDRLYRKLGVSNRCELVVRMFAEHLRLPANNRAARSKIAATV